MTLARCVPYSFTEFLEHVIGVRLSPAQRVLWRVLAGEAQPQDLEGEDREIARQLFGEVDVIPRELLGEVAIIKGARIGGSYLGALRILDLAFAAPLSTLAPGETAFGVIVAPDLRLASQTIRYVIGAIDATPALHDREVRRDATSVTVARDDGHFVTIETLPATRGGSALRGRTLVGALLDEASFFRDESAVVNDAELEKAIAPRVVPDGQIIVSSTPWAEAGLLFELFKDNWGAPKTCVAAHAPTRLLRSDAPNILAAADREQARDPDNYRREYQAEFMPAGSGAFFERSAIDAAIDETLVVPRPASSGFADPDDGIFAIRKPRVYCAADAAFNRDASTFCAIELLRDRTIRVLCLDELRPQKGSPLAPSVVLQRWAQLASGYGVATVRADSFYKESVREELHKHRIVLEPVPEGQKGKAAMYEAARLELNEGRLRLPNHHRLIAQLREVVSKPTPGGGMTISSPRKRGAHGDLVSALVAAVHAATAIEHIDYHGYVGIPRHSRSGLLSDSDRFAENADDEDEDDNPRSRARSRWAGIL